MMRRVICTLIAALGGLNTALAEFPDPGPDSFGLYFLNSEGEYVNEIAAEPGELSIYIILAGPTAHDGIGGWEVAFDWPSKGGTLLAVDYTGDAVNFSEPPEFVVGLGYGIPVSDHVILAELTFLYLSNEELPIFGGPVEPSSFNGAPGYVNIYSWLYPCLFSVDADGQFIDEDGWTTIPVAVINGDAPVATQRLSWSRIKNTYR